MKLFCASTILVLLHPTCVAAFCVSPGITKARPRTSLHDVQNKAVDGDVSEISALEMEAQSEDIEGDTDMIKDVGVKDISSLLTPLLTTAATTDRGQFASDTQKDMIASIISELESMSPSEGLSQPTLSPSIAGTWELVYSDTQLFRSSPFFMAGRAVCKDGEEAERYDWFCDMHRAALAISEIGKVRQIISSEGRMISEFETNVGSIPFLSDFTPLKYSGGLPFKIEGAIVSSADITPTPDGKGWSILMDTVEIKGSNIPLLRQILDSGRTTLKSRELGSFLENNVDGYTNPRPIFETTYMDNMIRISRDQDNKVFIYTKASDVTEATEYTSVDSDFGVLKLLEGLNDNFFKISI